MNFFMERVHLKIRRTLILKLEIVCKTMIIFILLTLPFCNLKAAAGTLPENKYNSAYKLNLFSLNCDVVHKNKFKDSPVNDTINVPTLDIKLYKNNTVNAVATDSVRLNFEEFYSNNIDTSDVVKTTYSQNNLSILKNNVELFAEKRPKLLVTDSIFLKIGNMLVGNYKLIIDPSVLNYPFLQAFIKDNYFQTETTISLNNISAIDFTITSEAASAVGNRFYIFFRPKVVAGSLPVTFISTQASKGENNQNIVKWKVAIELNLDHYETESSSTGVLFRKFGNNIFGVGNGSSAAYEQKDLQPDGEIVYYRVKAISTTGQFVYSNVAKVKSSKNYLQVQIMPNPVTAGNVHVVFNNRPGLYNYAIVNLMGNTIATGQMSVGKNRQEKNIILNANTAKGRYEMILLNEVGERSCIAMIVL